MSFYIFIVVLAMKTFSYSHYKRAIIIFILYLIRIAIDNRIVHKYYHYRYAITYVSIIMRHDSSPAFRHVRVSQIEIMLCGHYNRKYGAARYTPLGIHMLSTSISKENHNLLLLQIYTRGIAILQRYTIPRALSRIRPSTDRSLNT